MLFFASKGVVWILPVIKIRGKVKETIDWLKGFIFIYFVYTFLYMWTCLYKDVYGPILWRPCFNVVKH